jgi:hypothetical protein
MSKVWSAPEIEEQTTIVAQLHKNGGGNGSYIIWQPPA